MSTLWLIVLLVASPFVGIFLWAVITAIIRERRFARMPPRPPLRCPRCNSDQIDKIESGIGCGIDCRTGQHRCQSYEYGVCKDCGTPCGRWGDDQSYVLSDEAWQSIAQRHEESRKKAESWPFEPSNESQ